jgi:hypothetical protein
VEYKWLLIPDPADYRLPKPSPNAKPMPKSYKDKESLNTSKRQVDDIPRAEDPFVKGFTWAEFKNHKLLRNPAQVKVDLGKDNQIWFYLGKTSTEAIRKVISWTQFQSLPQRYHDSLMPLPIHQV